MQQVMTHSLERFTAGEAVGAGLKDRGQCRVDLILCHLPPAPFAIADIQSSGTSLPWPIRLPVLLRQW